MTSDDLASIPTIGAFFASQAQKFGDAPAFAQKENGIFKFWSYQELYCDICASAAWFSKQKLPLHARIVFITPRSYQRLVLEMACMACGYVSVPLFEGYCPETKALLLQHLEPSLVIEDLKLNRTYFPFPQMDWSCISPETVATIIHTSGTTDTPKGVMLTHQNILSQHRAHQELWNLPAGLRFLTHLPWHHVYGSTFERFLCFETGGCLYLDDSQGKDLALLTQNFTAVKPHLFFSVPLILDQLITAKKEFLHSELQFIFSAAAPLNPQTQNYFLSKRVPVLQGWGLTETSPSCTITPISLQMTDSVGFPIPGIEIKIQDDGEIAVRGNGVMKGYFKDELGTQTVMTSDGWFLTGDTGEMTPQGLKIQARKDRLFKLANGQKVNPQYLEDQIRFQCPGLKHIHVYGSGDQAPQALLFGGANLQIVIESLEKMNQSLAVKYQRISRFALINQELTVENRGLTSSFKTNHKYLVSLFKNIVDQLSSVDAVKSVDGGFLVNIKINS